MIRAITIEPTSLNGWKVTEFRVVVNPSDRLAWQESGAAVGFETFGEALDYAANEYPDTRLLVGVKDGCEVTEFHALQVTGMTHGMAALDRLRDTVTGE